jgi:hypothetical protein
MFSGCSAPQAFVTAVVDLLLLSLEVNVWNKKNKRKYFSGMTHIQVDYEPLYYK